MTKGEGHGTMLKYAHKAQRKTKIYRATKLKTEFRNDKIISNKCYPKIPLSLSNNPMDMSHSLLINFFSIYST
jgi:hypothetical protein